jgi:hypothetical protein
LAALSEQEYSNPSVPAGEFSVPFRVCTITLTTDRLQPEIKAGWEDNIEVGVGKLIDLSKLI